MHMGRSYMYIFIIIINFQETFSLKKGYIRNAPAPIIIVNCAANHYDLLCNSKYQFNICIPLV